jgi:hypothetical protein
LLPIQLALKFFDYSFTHADGQLRIAGFDTDGEERVTRLRGH